MPARLTDRVDVVILAALMLVGGILFFNEIGAASLWADEGATARVMTFSPGRLARHVLFVEPPSGFHYLVLRPWVAVFGTSEAGLRSLSAVATVATIPFVYLIGTRLAGRVAGAAAGVLFVANPFVVAYAQEARAYALAGLLVAAAAYALLRASQEGGLRTWVLGGLLLTAGIHAHFYAVFVAMGFGAWALFLPGEARRAAVITVGASLLASVPIGLAIVFWAPQRAWVDPPTSVSLGVAVTRLAGGRLDLPLSSVLVAVYLVAAGLAAWLLWRRSSPERRSELVFLLGWLTVPIAMGLLVSLVKPVFVIRSLLVLAPAAPVLLAVTAVRLGRPRLVAVVAPVVAVVVFVMAAGIGSFPEGKPDWRAAAAVVAERAEVGDALLVYPPRLRWRTAVYYLERTESGQAVKIINADEDDRLVLPKHVGKVADRHPRIWLLVHDVQGDEPPLGLGHVLRALNRRYEHVLTLDVHRIQVLLFERQP